MAFLTKRTGGNATARYILDTISPDAANPMVLEMRYAGEGNAGYMDAVLKSINMQRARSGAGQLTAVQLQAQRQEMVDAFATHVIAKWENVYENGEPAACTPDTVKRFLGELIAPKSADESDGDFAARLQVFDRLTAFARDPENFRGKQVSAEVLGKG